MTMAMNRFDRVDEKCSPAAIASMRYPVIVFRSEFRADMWFK